MVCLPCSRSLVAVLLLVISRPIALGEPIIQGANKQKPGASEGENRKKASGVPQQSEENPIRDERIEKLVATYVGWLAGEEFDRLEEEADRLRKNQSFVRAEHSLAVLYNCMNGPPVKEADKWQGHLKHVERWLEAKPESIAAHVIQAMAHRRMAWNARGTGYVDSVKPEGWRVFHGEIGKANEILQRAEKLKVKDPELYRLWIDIAKAQSWPRERVDQLLKKGQALDVRYYPMYQEMAEYLLPRWHGELGEVEEFAEQMIDELGEDEGKEVYFRIAAQVLKYEGSEIFERTSFSYPTLREGLQIIQHRYPDPIRYEVSGCAFACAALDVASARPLLETLRRSGIRRLFGSERTFNNMSKWADPNRPPGEQKRTLWGHGGPVYALSYSPDGNLLASTSARPVLWELETGRKLVSLTAHKNRVFAATFSKNSMLSTAGGVDGKPGELFLWKLPNVTEPVSLSGHTDAVFGLCFSAGADRLASASQDGTARIWSMQAPHDPVILQHGHRVDSVSFSPDGKLLATSGFPNPVKLWEVETGRLVQTLDGTDRTDLLQFTPQGLLAIARRDRTIRLWDVKNLKPMREFRQQELTFPITFSPDGQLMAAGDNQVIRLWNVDSGQELKSFRGHWEKVHSLAFAPDGNTLASGAWDQMIMFWDVSEFAASN